MEVKNCEVTLKGTVDRRAVKRLVENLAETGPGVKEVHNQLHVTPGQPGGQPQATQQGQKGRTTA